MQMVKTPIAPLQMTLEGGMRTLSPRCDPNAVVSVSTGGPLGELVRNREISLSQVVRYSYQENSLLDY